MFVPEDESTPFEFDPFRDANRLEMALQIVHSTNSTAAYVKMVESLESLLRNIKNNPLQVKFRKFPVDEPAFVRRVRRLQGSHQVMMALGFEKTAEADGEIFYMMTATRRAWDQLMKNGNTLHNALKQGKDQLKAEKQFDKQQKWQQQQQKAADKRKKNSKKIAALAAQSNGNNSMTAMSDHSTFDVRDPTVPTFGNFDVLEDWEAFGPTPPLHVTSTHSLNAALPKPSSLTSTSIFISSGGTAATSSTSSSSTTTSSLSLKASTMRTSTTTSSSLLKSPTKSTKSIALSSGGTAATSSTSSSSITSSSTNSSMSLKASTMHTPTAPFSSSSLLLSPTKSTKSIATSLHSKSTKPQKEGALGRKLDAMSSKASKSKKLSSSKSLASMPAKLSSMRLTTTSGAASVVSTATSMRPKRRPRASSDDGPEAVNPFGSPETDEEEDNHHHHHENSPPVRTKLRASKSLDSPVAPTHKSNVDSKSGRTSRTVDRPKERTRSKSVDRLPLGKPVKKKSTAEPLRPKSAHTTKIATKSASMRNLGTVSEHRGKSSSSKLQHRLEKMKEHSTGRSKNKGGDHDEQLDELLEEALGEEDSGGFSLVYRDPIMGRFTAEPEVVTSNRQKSSKRKAKTNQSDALSTSSSSSGSSSKEKSKVRFQSHDILELPAVELDEDMEVEDDDDDADEFANDDDEEEEEDDEEEEEDSDEQRQESESAESDSNSSNSKEDCDEDRDYGYEKAMTLETDDDLPVQTTWVNIFGDLEDLAPEPVERRSVSRSFSAGNLKDLDNCFSDEDETPTRRVSRCKSSEAQPEEPERKSRSGKRSKLKKDAASDLNAMRASLRGDTEAASRKPKEGKKKVKKGAAA